MIINAARVSSSLFRNVCQSVGVGVDLSSHDEVTADSPQDLRSCAHLRLDSSPEGASVGALLRLLPNDDSADIEENESSCGENADTVIMHPLILLVLLRSRSSCLANQHSRPSGRTEGERYPVMLSSSDGSVHGVSGWLEHLDAEDVHTMEGSQRAEIHLSYMCSNTSRGRRCFSPATRMDNDDISEGIDLLKQSLAGEGVAEGGIIGVDIGQSDGMHADELRDVAFFVVTKIAVDDDTATRNERYLRLPDRFEICLDDQPARMELENAREEDVNCYCPGYETVLEELLTLAKMDDPIGAPTAVVLSGCSGVGKSRMALWLTRELSHNARTFTASTISAKDILLEEAASSFDPSKHLETNAPKSPNGARLLIVDDLDAIVGNDDEGESSVSSSLESEQLRALNAIVKLLDGAIQSATRSFILGISRASWAQLPLQLARVGRFEKVVSMSPPTLAQRREIFKFWLSTLPLSGELQRDSIAVQWADLLAPRTAGCVAADIRRICADALTTAAARAHRASANEIVPQHEYQVEWEDVREAARACVPSQLSSMDVIPASLGDEYDSVTSMYLKNEFDLAWKSFGGYAAEKKRLYRTVVRPWKYHITETSTLSDHPEGGAQALSIEATLGVSKPSGVLFHGPPGCGKTSAAMCLASSLGLHCVKVRASEVFNQWLGGSEATLRSIFSRARAASPCILFFDELDSLATNREGGDSDATSGVQSRILTTLLNEMDGITNAGGKQGILVVAATNRLDAIDAALLRPGRLEEHVLLSFPRSACIQDILKIQTAKMPLDASVDITQLSSMLETSKASCAEIEGICRDACLIAMRRCAESEVLENLSVTSSDFDQAFCRIKKNPPG